jgi:putative chitinase
MIITAELLRAIGPVRKKGSAKESLMIALAEAMNKYFPIYGITTRLRICHFLAQCCQETDQWNTLEEYGGPSYWAKYENREDLGNNQKGDGVKFHGRGPIQITGRWNYTDFKRLTGIDVVSNPDILLDPDIGTKAACAYWAAKNINVQADADNVEKVTKLVNGGKTGLSERTAFLAVAKNVIKGDLTYTPPNPPSFPLPNRKPTPPIQGVPPEAPMKPVQPPIRPTPAPTPVTTSTGKTPPYVFVIIILVVAAIAGFIFLR